jgi:hypothetical protein
LKPSRACAFLLIFGPKIPRFCLHVPPLLVFKLSSFRASSFSRLYFHALNTSRRYFRASSFISHSWRLYLNIFSKEMTASVGQPKQFSQEGQTEQDRQNWSGRTRLLGQDRQNKSARTGPPMKGLPGQGCRDRTARTGLPRQGYQDTAPRTGLLRRPEQDRRERAAGTRQLQ